MPTPAKQYDESLVNYYDEELVGHADTVFRFGFALTLSVDSAHRLVRLTYQSANSKLKEARGVEGSAAVAWLLGECWRSLGELKGAKSGDGTSSVAKALKALPVEARAALAAVDVAGLSAAEAMRAFGWSDGELRGRLGAARKSLLGGGVEI